jgi:hypothetical protein
MGALMEAIQMNLANVEIDMVRKYARYARAVSTLFLILLAAAICFLLLRKLPGASSPGAKFWITAGLMSSALYAGFLFVLRRLFDALATGEIFSSRNVGHVRNIAYIFGSMGMFKVLVLLAYGILTANGVVEESVPKPGFDEPEDVVLADVFKHMLLAGILLLASWMMQVGLGVRLEADELKRDAELVV